MTHISEFRGRGWNLRRGAMPRPELEAHSQWKGDDALPTTKRARIQRRLPLGPCEKCGKPGTDRHHKDGDTGHNSRDNVAILCRRCHMQEDGRLARLIACRQPVQPPKPCVNCAVPYKPLRKGRCAACARTYRLYGVERQPCNAGKRDRDPTPHDMGVRA